MKLKKGYWQTELGKLPQDWEVHDISEVSLKVTDGDHATPKRSEKGYYLLSARNVLNGSIALNDVDYVENEEYQRMRQRCNPEFEDILISCSGTIGRVTIVPSDLECVLVRSVALIKPDKKVIDSLFVQYFLQSDIGQYQIFKSINQGAQPNLFINHIEKLKIPLPNISEQKAISSTLSEIDGLIQSMKGLLEKKYDIKRGAMQKLLTPKQDWIIKKLGDISDIYTGKKNNEDKVEEGLYPFFVRSQQVERINSYSFDGEAILIPGEGNIGEIFHYINDKFDFHQRVYKISDFVSDVSGKYIYYYLVQNFGIHAMKNSVKATVDSLRLPTFNEFQIELPKMKSEQLDIVTIISDMDAEIEAMESKLDKYKNIKQSMMQNLLTGRIRLI